MLKKVLVILMGLFGAPVLIRCPRNCALLAPPRYTPAAEQATSSPTFGQKCDSDSKGKNDSHNVRFVENCEDPASWPKRHSAAQRDFLIAKGPHTFVLNYEFPKDVEGRKFSNSYLQRKLSNGKVAKHMAGVLS